MSSKEVLDSSLTEQPQVSTDKRELSPPRISTASGTSSNPQRNTDTLDELATRLASLKYDSTAASIKSNTSKHSMTAEHSRAPYVEEPMQHMSMVEYSKAESIKGFSGSSGSTMEPGGVIQSISMLQDSQPSIWSPEDSSSITSLRSALKTESIKGLFSGSSGSNKKSEEVIQNISMVQDSQSSIRSLKDSSSTRSLRSAFKAELIKGLFSGSSDSNKNSGQSSSSATSRKRAQSSKSWTSRTPSVKDQVKLGPSSTKETFSDTFEPTCGPSVSIQNPAPHLDSISSADMFRQDCINRAEIVRQNLSNSGKEKPYVLKNGTPNVSLRTAKLAFAITQSMGGPEMPEGLEKMLKKKHNEK
ncbi:hypothetical protein EV426DRAFT_702324 [Tirmania nivea]|nr:hypothetical protein EV426DRAFT_702324 [Tirmania nivea]